ncbi:MAG: hypothetical protein FGM16_08755 [Flavobacterium sp.]|nr:hypothetical protein [Flavobacterium sp.]
MSDFKKHIVAFLLLPMVILLGSCNKKFKSDNYTAYFGGEVSNPTNPYVLFCRDNVAIDSVLLDENNRFFIKFDSLTPGLYTFKNDPEYQYVYFDKNDSIMVRVNAKDFDNSIVFCGRGDQKNNFLIELYLKNEADRNTIFDVFDYPLPKFISQIDASYKEKKNFYLQKKASIKWSNGFDLYAQSALNFAHFSKKELYPMAHKMRTGIDVIEELPKNYFSYRKNIDFNNAKLSNYEPFVTYLSYMLNNMGAINYHNHFTDVDLALKTNINKLKIADTLIKNEKVKNIILNNIAFTYLLEEQNMVNNQKFLDTYHQFSTDNSKKNEINEIGKAINNLNAQKQLPQVKLVDLDNKPFDYRTLCQSKTILFFWTKNLKSHYIAAHKKVIELKKLHPEYTFVAVNLDPDVTEWQNLVAKYNFKGIVEVQAHSFEEAKRNWAIMKVHRTIILDTNTIIKNAFTNLFDVDFEKEL